MSLGLLIHSGKVAPESFPAYTITMKINQLENIAKAHGTKRAAYECPKLREFGSVGALTQSGTMGTPENVNPQGMCVGNQPAPPSVGMC